MKNLSNDHAAGNAAGADSFAQMHLSPQLLDDVYWDLQVANVLRKNLLLVGDERAVRVALEALWLNPGEHVLRWHPSQPLDLPHGGGTGTLVLHDVGELSSVEQTRILYWFEDSAARIRVVSTNPEPLWPRVISGGFNETLYYRLNTVHVDVSVHAVLNHAMTNLRAC